MKEKIQKLFCENKSSEAFWIAAEHVMTDEYCRMMFLRIANIKNHIIQLFEDIDKIRELADKGNPYMQYAYARLHDILYFAEDSASVSEEYYKKAMDAGIADARMQLAYIYRDGDLGEFCPRLYNEYMEQAINENSERAIQNKLYEMIYGSDYIKKDTEKALKIIKEYLDSCDTEPSPYFYLLKAKAEEVLGMREEACKDYELAAEKGNPEALFFLAIMTCCDENYKVRDCQRFSELMVRGQDASVAACYLEAAFLLDSMNFEDLDEKAQADYHSLLKNQLILASEMGDDLAGYYLGMFYEQGINGFEQDYAKAFQWYSRGALLRSCFCHECLYRMILEDFTAPKKYTEEFGYECAYRALVLRCDTLDIVINGYKKGYLTHHAAVIEEYFMPRYEKSLEDSKENDDYLDDIEGPEIEEDCYSDYDDYNLYDDIVENESPEMNNQGTETVSNTNSKKDSPQTLSALLDECYDCADQATEAMKKRGCQWKAVDFVRKFADAADILKSYEHMLNHLYSLNKKMIDIIYDHPRLKLRLCKIQYAVLSWIEAKAEHSLDIIEDIRAEIDTLSRCIALADEGRLEEIPKTGHLKRDPVEWTKEWEEVIDEADRIAYEEIRDLPDGMGWCFAFWHARANALRQFGIQWRSPSVMNPNVMFD